MIKISKNQGKIFEEDFKNSINTDKIYYQRIKDPAASFGQDSSKTRFSPNNPYDNYCYIYPNFFAFELKSTKEKNISFSLKDNSKQIKKCQIFGLDEANRYKGIVAGFIFNFREQEQTYFLHIDNFMNFINENNKSEKPKKSINLKDVLEFGGILIPYKKKKVRYIYDLDVIFNLGRKNND